MTTNAIDATPGAGGGELRALLDQAESAIRTYKHPGIDEACERLDAILQAANLGGIDADEVTYLRIGRQTVSIGTTYSVRSCTQHRDFEFPTWIIDAVDPVAAARRWGLEERRRKAESEVREAEAILARRRAQLDDITTRFSDLDREDPSHVR